MDFLIYVSILLTLSWLVRIRVVSYKFKTNKNNGLPWYALHNNLSKLLTPFLLFFTLFDIDYTNVSDVSNLQDNVEYLTHYPL